jgi:predicted secreted acid phosphatase
MVCFGDNPSKSKVLILDMDETMLQAKFIQSDEEAATDDGDF